MSAGIELLRGLAALMVVLAHYHGIAELDSWLLKFMYTGVDLFFVISGFVFAPYLAGKPLRWDAFLIRRAFRIFPLYLVALSLYAALRWRTDGSFDYVLVHALLLHTWESREIAFHFNPAFWSLPVEVEFYLLLPILAMMIRSVRAFAWLCGVAFVLHILIIGVSPRDTTVETLPVVLSFHLPGLLIEFLFGVAAWLFLSHKAGALPRTGILILGVLLWLFLASAPDKVQEFGAQLMGLSLHANVSMLAALSYSLMICAILPWLDQRGPYAIRVFRLSGNLSFGVYLLHNAAPQLLWSWKSQFPPMVFVSVCLLATLCAAWLTHHACEAPLRRLGQMLASARAS